MLVELFIHCGHIDIDVRMILLNAVSYTHLIIGQRAGRIARKAAHELAVLHANSAGHAGFKGRAANQHFAARLLDGRRGQIIICLLYTSC